MDFDCYNNLPELPNKNMGGSHVYILGVVIALIFVIMLQACSSATSDSDSEVMSYLRSSAGSARSAFVREGESI